MVTRHCRNLANYFKLFWSRFDNHYEKKTPRNTTERCQTKCECCHAETLPLISRDVLSIYRRGKLLSRKKATVCSLGLNIESWFVSWYYKLNCFVANDGYQVLTMSQFWIQSNLYQKSFN